MKRVMTRPEHWQAHFAAQSSSGFSVTEYRRQHSIRSSQWYYWQKRLRDMPSQSVSLVPVHITAEPSHSSNWRVHLPNGIVLEFGSTFDPARLAGQMMILGQT